MSDCSGSTSKPGCALTLLLLDAARAVEARAEIALSEVGLSLAKLGALRHLVPDDRRTIRAEVTPRGRAAYDRASVLLAELERALDSRLGVVPRAEFARQLLALREG
jgi:hypothetical protein